MAADEEKARPAGCDDEDAMPADSQRLPVKVETRPAGQKAGKIDR